MLSKSSGTQGMRVTRILLVILASVLVFSTSIPRAVASTWQTDVPLNQALVLEGGESTNPRDYDPATTHGNGDKLAFSGLVSFDTKLSLTPDLAERWDISPDGLVYTFHLRANAKFHDGRAVTAKDV